MDWNNILKRFVAKESERYPGLVRPWKLRDGRVAATDGHALIILNSEVVEADEPTEKVPDVDVVVSLKLIGKPKPFPLVPALEQTECSLCKGKKKGHKCKECNGTGEHECECNMCTEDECGDCKGTGFVRVLVGTGDFNCPKCSGNGAIINMDHAISIFDSKFRVFDLHRFDGLQIKEVQMLSGSSSMQLKFDEGVGVICSLVQR